MKSNRRAGLLFVIVGATFWGIGGTVTKKLFQDYEIDVNWLVTTRLLLAGLLLLLLSCFGKNRREVLFIWKEKQTALQLVTYSILGMLGVQYTYMAAIHHGNAAVATLLQYLAPVIIIVYLLFRRQMRFTRQDGTILLLALTGCFFLLTNGSLSTLSVHYLAIVWGLLSAVCSAFYTLYAVRLLKRFDSLVVVGWSMVVGGVALSFIRAPWEGHFDTFTFAAYGYLLFVIIFGTMLAFWLYIKSLDSLPPKETSLLGSLEPLAAVLTTVFWLQQPFGFFQWVGAACIFGVVFLLTLQKTPKANTLEQKDPPLKIS